MPRLSRSRRTLDLLLADAELDREVASVDLLSVGWRGRGGGPYRDDDGTHARVLLADGTSVVYREYATTSAFAAAYMRKETFVFRQLAEAGLPTPRVLASVDGSAAAGGDPAAMLLADAGGDPLEVLFRDAKPALWTEVGRTLRSLHEVDVTCAGPIADHGRLWMRTVPYEVKSLRAARKRRPDLAPRIDELVVLLQKKVAPYVEATRPRAICCSQPPAMPGMMLQREGARWRCVSWLSLGYYVSIGDPDRDLVAIATRAGRVPDEFYAAYGRRPDPVCELAYLAHRRLDELPRIVEGLDELLH